MVAVVDLTGQVFLRLRVTGRNPQNDKHGRAMWDCVCECGKTVTVFGGNLRNGNTRSCGCFSSETSKQNVKKAHASNVIEDKIRDCSEYVIWKNMKARCNNDSNPAYQNYGGRGIQVCDRWSGDNGFENFLADMGPRPSDEHSIDRENNDGNYEPSNCHWATDIEQANNKRNNVVHSYKGRRLTIAQLAKETNVSYFSLRWQLSKDQTPEQAVEAIHKLNKEKS